MSVFLRLFGYLRPYRLTFGFCLLLVFLGSAAELLKPWPLKIAVDQIIGHEPLSVFGWVIPYEAYTVAFQVGSVVLMLVVVHILTGVIQLINNYLTIRIGQDMIQDFRRDIFDHLQRQSLLFHQKMPTGDLLYRLLGDTYAVQSLFMNGVFTTLSSGALLIGMFVVLLRLDAELTLYSLAIIPLLLIAIIKISRKIGTVSMESYNLESRVYSTAERILSSIGLIQAFAREEDERHTFLSASQDSFNRKLALYSWQTGYGLVVSALTAGGTALVLWVGILHVLDGSITTGELLIFLSYLATLYAPVNQLSTTVGAVQAALSQAKRALDVLSRDEAVAEARDARPLAITKGEVVYDDVSFGYDPARPTVGGVNLVCPGGTMTALVGQTGAGKTTMISLLLRFFDPQTGAVRIDGQDLREVKLKSLREQIAVVLQDTQLFPMSVRENIAYGRKNASFEDVERAAKLANAHDFILELPEGYDTVLGERGSSLSGGQRQRIAIARALLKDAPILVLDEPTSALDAETEALIMQGLERLMENRTTFVIAHRLSLMRRADQIVFIKDHRIAEVGTFAELLAKNGQFARLHAIQFGAAPDAPATVETVNEPDHIPA